MLRFVELVPTTLLVSMEVIRYAQSMFVQWDVSMHSLSKYVSAKVHRSSLMEQLGQVSYILSDKTGTLTANQFVFRKMSIGGVSYGKNERECEDAASREVTNFNMVDSDLNKVIKSRSGNSYELIQRFLYHLALCHTVLTVQNKKDKHILAANSPDELALINAAKYYGVSFLERNQYNELIIENGHHQQSQIYKYELLKVIEFNSDRKRMTVIVKAPNGQIRVLSKGADSVMAPLLAETWEN